MRERLPFASATDLAALAYSAAGWLATAALPQSVLLRLARWLAVITVATQPGLVRSGAAQLCDRLGGLDPQQGAALFRDHLRRRHEHVLGRLREAHRRRWRPALELAGREHLEQALARGRGAVLWGMAFCGPLVWKMALARSGFAVVQLSRPDHGGFSRSWVSLRILNRLTIRAEDRHLAGRILLEPGGRLEVVRQLRRKLEADACIGISGEHPGRRNVIVSCLGVERPLATGAPSLARSTGAALLTLHAHRLAANAYRVVIDPPLPLSAERGARPIENACRALGARLERQIRAHPADWEGWSAPHLEAVE